jgi:hypothetical protein
VSAVQVLLWNEGKASIHPEHVLVPVQITIARPAAILEATLVKQNRDVVGMRLSTDDTLLQKGQLPLAFKIMEKGDCAVVQLVYVGPRDSQIEVLGTIEGQARVRNVGSVRLSQKDLSSKWAPWFFLVVSGAMAYVAVRNIVAVVRVVRSNVTGPERTSAYVGLVEAAVMIGVIVTFVVVYGYTLTVSLPSCVVT